MTAITHLQGKTAFSSLPDVCVEHLLSYLPITEILAFKKTQKHFYKIPLQNLSYTFTYTDTVTSYSAQQKHWTIIKMMKESHRINCNYSSIEIGLFPDSANSRYNINFNPHIESLSCFRLKKLKLEGSLIKLTDAQFNKLTEISTLEDLTLATEHSIPNLRHLQNLPRLKSLVIHAITNDELHLLFQLNSLATITIYSPFNITDEGFQSSKQSKIKKMTLQSCISLTINFFDHLKEMSHLEELTLYNCHKQNSTTLEEFSLDFWSKSPQRTGDTQLRWVAEKFPKLKKFNNENLNRYRKNAEVIIPLDAEEVAPSPPKATSPLKPEKSTIPSIPPWKPPTPMPPVNNTSASNRSTKTQEPIPVTPAPVKSPAPALPASTPANSVTEEVVSIETVAPTPDANSQSVVLPSSEPNPVTSQTPPDQTAIDTPPTNDAQSSTSSGVISCITGFFQALYNFFAGCIRFLRNLYS